MDFLNCGYGLFAGGKKVTHNAIRIAFDANRSQTWHQELFESAGGDVLFTRWIVAGFSLD